MLLLLPAFILKFEGKRLADDIDAMAKMIDDELNIGIDGTDIRAGMIGEIGCISFSLQMVKNSLRAAALAQNNNPPCLNEYSYARLATPW